MDGKQFDDFTRFMARGTSRRKVLKGLAGGAFGGALVASGVVRPHFASAQECFGAGGTSCQTDDDCCQGHCSGTGVCFCSSPTEPTLACWCNSDDQCSSDGSLICCSAGGSRGICSPPNSACIPIGTTTTTTTSAPTTTTTPAPTTTTTAAPGTTTTTTTAAPGTTTTTTTAAPGTPTTTTTATPSAAVASLPNTGSGSSGGNAGGILTSAALIGGGAAILGHQLRKNRAEAEAESEPSDS